MGFWKDVSDLIKAVDIVVEVVDARMPELSRNREVEKLVRKNRKELVKAFNKIDLVSKGSLEELRDKYKGDFLVSVRTGEGMKGLRSKLRTLAKEKGFEKIGFVGYPNAGKSALINFLTRRGKAKVSSKAGTTRGIQWINFDDLKILDSPGVIPNNEWNEVKLALLNAKNVNKLKDPRKVAIGIIDIFLKDNPEALRERYGLEENIIKKESWDIFEMIGEKMRVFKKKGEVDENRVAFMIVNDWQKGRLKL
ncbi:hypothetical protein CO038_01695 [Candidatus Pacearchaeota archaeon CG_4_9_14_0_2_um_filter_39_13]|nr:GTPase RsgA [Candidatus Pacearchaeota archaeon]OIO42468.1 MAG: hypothetical protein AUJ64_04135 [Candidatus Pacearchaeota archaeon CG1_02_39_14]PJC44842.1 MAG: hypothetical protein CO038_01695 [Candidatus Pacearchaeota archaeon CG_4_9_14_0_2_um_filter_39_13]